jgi:hypothetical protein
LVKRDSLYGPVPIAAGPALKASVFGKVPTPLHSCRSKVTAPAPFALADRMPSVEISFGSSGCGLAVLICKVSGSGAVMAVMARTLIAIEDGEFSTFGTRQ